MKGIGDTMYNEMPSLNKLTLQHNLIEFLIEFKKCDKKSVPNVTNYKY